jgi:YD repeat-containing protein
VETFYDALNRQTRTRETVTPFASQHIRYTAGNRTVVTDPNGNVSTTKRSGYGEPGDGNTIQLAYPENSTTNMTYDIYGNIRSATQSGVTQQWTYDSRYRVCAHSTPETRTTRYRYDNANQNIAFAQGQPAGCGALSSSSLVQNTFNTLGLINHVNYAGSTPDVSIGYDLDNNVTRNIRGAADWSYQFDANNQLLREQLRIDNRTYTGNYNYNSNGYLTGYTSPTGRAQVYANDGFGRPTQVRDNNVTRASSGQYHPNGTLASLYYNNGLTLTNDLNTRQLVHRTRVQRSSHKPVDFTYSYGANKNITQILNGAVTGDNRTLRYDGLDRLTHASGPWGNGSYQYDNRNNLLSKQLGSRTVSLAYQTNTNHLSYSRDSRDSNHQKLQRHPS